MAWNAAKPAGADKIKDSDDNIRLNNAAIETVLGTNITAGPTTIQGAIQGDSTKGRILRASQLKIDNGTNGVSLKCTVISLWNGDAIAVTDDIIKDATTGNFSLNAAGTQLRILNAGITGTPVFAMGILYQNASGADLTGSVSENVDNILILLNHPTTGVAQDITTLADTGIMYFTVLYVTSA